jgi:hypothetical protein
LSDGVPEAAGYSTAEAIPRVAREIRRLGAAGIPVAALQFGANATDDQIQQMYGGRYRRIDQARDIPGVVARLVLDFARSS